MNRNPSPRTFFLLLGGLLLTLGVIAYAFHVRSSDGVKPASVTAFRASDDDPVWLKEGAAFAVDPRKERAGVIQTGPDDQTPYAPIVVIRNDEPEHISFNAVHGQLRIVLEGPFNDAELSIGRGDARKILRIVPVKAPSGH